MHNSLGRWYPVALALIGAAISLAVFERLPAQMAVHWDLQGTPNWWVPRAAGAFFAPGMLLLVWGLLRVLPLLDPRRVNYEKFSGAYDITAGAVLLLLFATHFVVLALALGYRLPLSRLVPSFIGVLFIVVGNVMPRVRSNFMFGIRTPWTLSNDRVWMRTHRLAGYTMTVAGFAMICAGILLPVDLVVTVVTGAAVAALIGPVVYSYLTWQREMKQ